MQLPQPNHMRLGPEVRPYIWLKRLGVRLRLQPKGCTHKGYLREVWCIAPESLRARLDLGLSRPLSGARLHADRRSVAVPLKRRRG